MLVGNKHEIGKLLVDYQRSFVFAITNESEIFQFSLSKDGSGNFHIKILQTFSGYHDQVLDIKKIQNKGILVCTNSDYVKYYDLETKQLSLLFGNKDTVTCCDFFNNILITGCKNGQIFVWDFDYKTNKFIVRKKYQGH